MAAIAVTVAGLQRLNSVELAGSYGRSSLALDEMILEHLQQQQALARLSWREQLYCRLVVEGFTHGEIAAELGVSVRSVVRIASSLRGTLDFAA